MWFRFSRWPPRRPFCIAKRNDFSSSESLRRSDASHQVSAQSILRFGRCRLKNFKMAAMTASWILERNDFSNSESLCCSNASHQVSAQSDMVWEELSFEEFQDGMAAILDIGMERF